MAVGSAPTDLYVVHVYLSRPDDDDPSDACSVLTHVTVWRTDDPADDEQRACTAAVEQLRPHLNNSAHVKTLAVLV